MVYRAYIPRKPLSDFVEEFWFYEGYAPRGSVEGLLPDGSMNLIVNLGGDEGPRLFDPARKGRAEGLDGCVVIGTHSGFAIVDTAGLATSMGVHFKPGRALPFLGFSAAELRDAHAPLESTVSLAVEIAREEGYGRRGIDTTFFAGDPERVFTRRASPHQDPLLGHPAHRKRLDEPGARGTMKQLARLGQAFVISDEGLALSVERFEHHPSYDPKGSHASWSKRRPCPRLPAPWRSRFPRTRRWGCSTRANSCARSTQGASPIRRSARALSLWGP